MIIIPCEPNTPDWHAARCGKLTASRVCDIVRRTKDGVSKSRNTYMGELIAERLSGQQVEGFTSKEMAWGHEHEDTAASTYAFMHDADVVHVGGVVSHPHIEAAAASPDRLVGADGLLEIKCPNSATHIGTLLGASVDPDYIKQMQWQMACTGRAWCDFLSFDPRMPADMQLHVQRFGRDDVLIRELETEAEKFLLEVSAKVGSLILKFRREAA